MTAPKRVVDVYGEAIADRLARWAIDALVQPPTRISTGTTRLSARMVEEGREILDEAGFDWRAWKREHHAGTSARRARRSAS